MSDDNGPARQLDHGSEKSSPATESSLDQHSSIDWSSELPRELRDAHLVPLCLTTPPPISEHLVRLPNGECYLVHWDAARGLYHWCKVSEEYAREKAEPVRRYRGLASWTELFDGVDVKNRSVTPGLAAATAANSAAPKGSDESTGSGEGHQPAGPAAAGGFLGGTDLLAALGIAPSRRDAFLRRLTRVRLKLGDDNYQEVRDPRPRAPRFLYRVNSPGIQKLAAGYTQDTSA